MTDWIAVDDQGDSGMPGTSYSKKFAGVKKTKNGQYQLEVRYVWGSHQGYLEEHGRVERKFRSPDLDELLRIGVSEIEGDAEFEPAGPFKQAIRNAIYEAQDANTDDE